MSSERVNIGNKQIQLLGDRVLIKPAPKKTVTESGLAIPETAKEDQFALGTLSQTGNMRTYPYILKPGDEVLIPNFNNSRITLVRGKDKEEEYVIMREVDIQGRLGTPRKLPLWKKILNALQ